MLPSFCLVQPQVKLSGSSTGCGCTVHDSQSSRSLCQMADIDWSFISLTRLTFVKLVLTNIIQLCKVLFVNLFGKAHIKLLIYCWRLYNLL